MADYVSKYTGSQIDGNLDKAAELPTHTNATTDGGKFLKISENDGSSLEWDRINGVPSGAEANDGAFLRVFQDSQGYYMTWALDNIPSYDAGEVGKFLTVYSTDGYDGLKWDNPIPTCDTSDNGKFLTVYTTDGNAGTMWSTIYPSNPNANDCLMAIYNENNNTFSYDWGVPFPEYDSQVHEGITALTINGYGEREWVDIIPYYSDFNENEVLTVNASGELEWSSISVLPNFDYNNEGQVLTVNAQGGLEWNAPSSGDGALVIEDTGTPADGAIPVYDNGHWVTKSISELISE